MNSYCDVILFDMPVGFADAADMVNDAIHKAIPYLAPLGISIQYQEDYITNTEVIANKLHLTYTLEYTGNVEADLGEYIFELEV